jgi:deoxyribonucleoside regulator
MRSNLASPTLRPPDSRLEILAQIAELYFVEGLSQEQIADRTNYSRSMISRLLTEARGSGVVEIRIHHPLARVAHLEQTLIQQFGLKTARVLATASLADTQSFRRLGALAAQALDEYLRDGCTIGLSWGRALAEMVDALRPRPRANIHVVQIIGSLGNRLPELDGAELVRRLANTLRGQYHALSAPLIVASDKLRNALMEDRIVREVFDRVNSMDIALVGIGSPDPEQSSLVRSGFLTGNDSRALLAQGAVGDVCAVQLDIQGQQLKTALNHCIIGIEPAELRRVPLRIGIAGGEAKGAPIVAAARSGMINALVIDEFAALAALRIANAT